MKRYWRNFLEVMVAVALSLGLVSISLAGQCGSGSGSGGGSAHFSMGSQGQTVSNFGKATFVPQSGAWKMVAGPTFCGHVNPGLLTNVGSNQQIVKTPVNPQLGVGIIPPGQVLKPIPPQNPHLTFPPGGTIVIADPPPRSPRKVCVPPVHGALHCFRGRTDGIHVAGKLIDVELLEVRQVDAGDSQNDLGPAFRVWFRNNSVVDIHESFSVGLMASTSRRLSEDFPMATARVGGMKSGETLSVDIRLPIAAQKMGLNYEGQPVPFSWLFTDVDSSDELPDSNRTNNSMFQARSEILVVEK
jgi:hypothetical protein